MAPICPAGQLIDDGLGQTTPWHGFPQLYLQQIPRASAFLSGMGFFPRGHLHGGHLTFAQGLFGGDCGEQLRDCFATLDLAAECDFFPTIGDFDDFGGCGVGGCVEQDSSWEEGEGGSGVGG
jgi:hypothetical protein